MSVTRVILVAVGVILAAVGLSALAHRIADERAQDALDAFYATPAAAADARPGTLLRVESLPAADVVGGTAYRILYRSERPNGAVAVSGAMAFVPAAPAPASGRPVLAYAHGTIGQGRGCAPSRRRDPLGPNGQWISQAVRSGYAVVAPDYTGIGTAGPNLYLVGEAEARDVVNAVRALDDVPGAEPGRRWVAWGHSQGGHSALWTGSLAAELMPERELVAVGAVAPAADLPRIIGAAWSTGVGWIVGPEVLRSWPFAYPEITPDEAVAGYARRWTDRVADACLGEGLPLPTVLGVVAGESGFPYFDGNPLQDPALAAAAAAETPKPLRDLPLLVAQGTADAVVPPAATAALQEEWCAAGVDLTMMWLGGIGHVNALRTAGPAVVSWLDARMEGEPVSPACTGAAPVGDAVSLPRDALSALD